MSCVADVVCQCPGLSALQRADGENRSENRGGSLAAIIADFCNKICPRLPGRERRMPRARRRCLDLGEPEIRRLWRSREVAAERAVSEQNCSLECGAEAEISR
jgi:hypothetical protein